MKKVLVGCLFLFVIAIVATVVGGYFFIWKPISGAMVEIREFAEYESRIDNKEPWVGPADYMLTPEQVTRFVAVNTAVDAVVGERWEALQQIANQQQTEVQSWQELQGVMRTLGDALRVAGDARDAQVTALNAQGFSLAEYTWIRDRFLSVLVPGIDSSQLEQYLRNGTQFPQIDINAIPGIGTGTPSGTGTPAPAAVDDPKPGATPPVAEVKPGAAAPGAAVAPGTPNPAAIDPIEQLPGGRAAYTHNRALVEPHLEQAQRWVRYWAASF